ncbi:MAG: hypothetical protein KDA25_00770, partial [Phycisphaerales bacterium]|nr:hypothetical protein [Phycisphaerales bacterium]
INGNSDDSGISGATVTHSCIAGGAAGEGNVDADPGFVDAAAGNYRLGAGSPCLDAGAPGPVPATVDVDGQPRVMGAAVDMGIDERPSPDLDGDTVVDAADLAALLSQWGSCLLCAADLDEDGAISSTDLAAMLAAWGR